jgi:hypothetical protein
MSFFFPPFLPYPLAPISNDPHKCLDGCGPTSLEAIHMLLPSRPHAPTPWQRGPVAEPWRQCSPAPWHLQRSAVPLAPKPDVYVPRGHAIAFAPWRARVLAAMPPMSTPLPLMSTPHPSPTVAHAAIHTRWGPLVLGEAEKSCYFSFIPLYSHMGVGYKNIHLWSYLRKSMLGTNTASCCAKQTLNFKQGMHP